MILPSRVDDFTWLPLCLGRVPDLLEYIFWEKNQIFNFFFWAMVGHEWLCVTQLGVGLVSALLVDFFEKKKYIYMFTMLPDISHGLSLRLVVAPSVFFNFFGKESTFFQFFFCFFLVWVFSYYNNTWLPRHFANP